MTPLEEQKMRAAVARQLGQPVPPGMLSQSAGTPDINAARQRAAGSTKGAESKLAQQQAYANSLRGGKMPDGREVGPSGIYVQANAGEMAKYAADQLAGGYLAGQAGKAADELDVAQTDVKLGGLELEDARTGAANQFSTDERVAGQDFSSGLQQSKLAAQAAIAAADRGAANTRAQNTIQAAVDKDTRAGKPVMMQPLGGGDPYPVIENNGRYFNYDPAAPDGRGAMADVRGAIPLDTTATGSGATLDKYQLERQADAAAARWESEVGTQAAMDDISSRIGKATMVLSNPDLEAYTGLINPDRFFSQYGIGEEAWRGQNVDQQLRYSTVAGIGELSSIFKPMSDTDLKELLKSFPQDTNDPKAITAWFGNAGRANIEKQYREARRTARTDAERTNLDNTWKASKDQLDTQIAKAAYRQGISADDADRLGMDKDELEYRYARLAAAQAGG